MNKLAIVLALVLLAWLAYSSYWSGTENSSAFVTDTDFSDFGLSPDSKYNASGSELEQRLVSLEQQLAFESEQRQQLQAMLEQLLEQLPENQDVADMDQPRRPLTMDEPPPADPREQIRERMESRNSDARRLERLESSGFDSQQAAWIVEREKQLELQELDNRWEQRRQE